MRFIDVRNLLGKAFCDYLLTGEHSFREFYLTFEVAEVFKSYAEGRRKFYETFVEEFGNFIPAREEEVVVFLGKTLNNLGYYFEAHEVVEKFWLGYRGRFKRFLQALIQVSIANMHLEGGNLKGYNRMRELALKNFEGFDGIVLGINLPRLREEILKGEGFLTIW
jgi:hypothetical protein